MRDLAQLAYACGFLPVIRQNMAYVSVAQMGLITELKEKHTKGYSMQNEIKIPHFFFTLVHFDFLNACAEFFIIKVWLHCQIIQEFGFLT